MAYRLPLNISARRPRAGAFPGGTVRLLAVALAILTALTAGIGIGKASDRDETSLTAQVSSAEHETDEGYFSLGADATVMAKPGTPLFRFLARQKGQRVRLTLTQIDERQLSRLDHGGR
jgi:hypothetical protein